MQFSTLFAAAGFASLAAAAPMELETRGTLACGSPVAGLTAGDCNILSNLGVKAMGTSAGTSVGTKNPNTWNVQNKSGKSIIIVAWGNQGSWVNAVAPDVTYTLAPGASVTLSTPVGYSGAMSAIYGTDTKLVNGQISNTWLEFTTGQWGVINVSREVNTKGNTLSATLTSTSNQKCTTDFTKCYFSCTGAPAGNTCWQPFSAANPTGYQLYNCAGGSQPGAQKGSYAGGDSGGCGGFSATGGHTDVIWS